jgi:lysophospholipase L1-like esterase
VNQNKSYFFQSLAIVFIAILSFIGFKSFLPRKLFAESTLAGKNVVVDSLMLDAIKEGGVAEKDTLTNTTISFASNPLGIKFDDEKFEQYQGYQHLIPFFEKLYQLEAKKTGKARIAYFGDSMTDGDMIVQDIRIMFQSVFGGEGVGFVNVTSESAASRGSIMHEFSPSWKSVSYLKTKKPARSFGVSGSVFFANDTLKKTWVKYKAFKTKFSTNLNNPTLLYGSSKNKNASISYKFGKDTIYKKLTPNSTLNLTQITGNLKEIKVNFHKADSIPFYGFNFDNGKGIHVDNFSSRGNSGLALGTFNTELMQAFNNKLGYDLIVLQFGTNVLNYGSLDFSWYERKMEKVVAHLKECFPGVAILIVTTADKSTKYDLKMKSDSAVSPLVMSQKRYSVKAQAGFVNLYTLMGGNGSMVKWVENVPAKANKDYTHFNHRGAKEVAGLIYNQINTGYVEYKKLRSLAKAKRAVPKVNIDTATATETVPVIKDTLNE